MNEIEQKALALVNEVADDSCHEMDDARFDEVCSALFRAIEQHEAFRQEVSDAVVAAKAYYEVPMYDLSAFIIAKPDPLVEALHGVYFSNYGPENVRLIRAAIEENGGKIVWGEG